MIRHIWFQNRQNQLQKSPPEENETEAQNVIFNWKGRIPLLFYCVKHIYGQFNIKLI
jgi:hypothetical protein